MLALARSPVSHVPPGGGAATLLAMTSRPSSRVLPSVSTAARQRDACVRPARGALCAALLSWGAAGAVALLAGATPRPASAQQEVLPAIADSSTAQTLLDDLRAQAAQNPAEAARLARRLLDEYAGRVAKVDPAGDELFASVGDLVERFLLEQPPVLALFRSDESRAAERMLAEQGAEATASRRRWTPAGLKATITLAERALTSDRAEESLALLRRVERHPDLAGRERIGHAALMAAASLRLGLPADGAIAALEDLSRTPDTNATVRAEIDAALAQARRTPPRDQRTRVRSPLVSASATAIPDASWREIWSIDLDGTLFRRLFDGPMTTLSPRVVERARADASWMTAVPTVVGRTVFLSEGQRVRAFDADSRDELWERTLGATGIERDAGGVGDLSALAVDSDSVVAYEGHAFAASRSGPSRIWCLDAATGDVRWSVDLARFEGREDFEGLFPVGTPLLFESVVVVSTRKSTQRLEQVDWLIAFDREDGSVRWAVSIAGAPGTRIVAGRRHAGMTADGDAVLVSTPLGVTARVRVSDGSFTWLRRVSVPLRESRIGVEPWEIAAPVSIAGKVLVLSPDDTELAALDIATGALIESRPVGPETTWGEPRYLLGGVAMRPGTPDATPVVLSVGRDIVAFDARDFTRPLWSLSRVIGDAKIERAGAENRNGIRGRVSVAGNAVLVPGVDEYLVLDLGTGAIAARIPGQKPGNPVLTEDRIVTAGDDALRILMPPERAESILRARLEASPNDPGAALALVELARATARPALALEAAATARDALARGSGTAAIRDGLLEQLIALAGELPESGDAAYAIVDAIADSPKLRVRALLARGDFLRAKGSPREAVRVWSTLAADPALGPELVERDGIARSTRSEAMARVARIAARDTDITARLDDEAARELAQLQASGADGERLLMFANAHPRTAASTDAVVAAARSLGSVRAARAFEGLLADLLVPPARVELADRVAAELVKIDGTAAGGDRIMRRTAQLLVPSGLTRETLSTPSGRLAKVGLEPGTGRDLRGRIARMTGGAFLSRAPELALIVSDGAMQRLDLTTLESRWRLRLDDRDPLILHASDRIVLWQSVAGASDVWLVIDSETGAVEFSTPRSDEIWSGGVELVDATGAMATPDGGAFLPAQVLPFCDGESLVLVRRNGDVARYSVPDVKVQPRFSRGLVKQVYAVSLADGLLTIAGRGVPVEPRTGGEPAVPTREDVAADMRDAASAATDLVPVVYVLDAATLEVRLRVEPTSGDDVRWAFATPIGEVFLGTSLGVERWTTGVRGQAVPVLETRTSDCSSASSPNLLGGGIVVLDRNDQPLTVPLFDGPISPIEMPVVTAFGYASLRSMIPAAEGLLIHAENRMILRGHGGELLGTDLLAGDLNLVFALPAAPGVFVFNGLGGRQAVGAGLGNFRVDFPYVVQALSPAGGLRMVGQPFEIRAQSQRADRAIIVDGWILMSSSQGTMAVALPVQPPGAVPADDAANAQQPAVPAGP